MKTDLDYFRRLGRKWQQDKCSLMAAAVSFYVLLSIFPLLLAATAALGYVLGSSQRATEYLMGYVSSFLPHLEIGIRDLLDEVVTGREAAGAIAVLVFVWSGTQVFVVLEKVVSEAWEGKRARSWLISRAIALGLLPLIGLLAAVSIALGSVLNLIQDLDLHIAGRSLAQLPVIWPLLAVVLSFATAVLLFALIYLVLPNCRVRVGSAFLGALVGAGAWEISKYGFGWYVAHIASFSRVYGSLGVTIVFVLWSYYSALALLLGAEIAASHQKRAENLVSGALA